MEMQIKPQGKIIPQSLEQLKGKRWTMLSFGEDMLHLSTLDFW